MRFNFSTTCSGCRDAESGDLTVLSMLSTACSFATPTCFSSDPGDAVLHVCLGLADDGVEVDERTIAS